MRREERVGRESEREIRRPRGEGGGVVVSSILMEATSGLETMLVRDK